MNVLIVDDERIAIENLKLTLNEFKEIKEITDFRSSIKALDWLSNHHADIAFLDIHMKNMDGLTLAKKVKEADADCAIIFVTGYSEYALQAIKMHAAGYLMKPVSKDDIKAELEYVKNLKPVLLSDKKVCVRCFGNFEVFINGQPVKFQYSKTKEFFAYLVDRKGAFCTNGEIMGILWEDDADMEKRKSYFRDLRSDLQNVFKEAGCEDIIERQRGSIAIIPDKVQCDYYDWEKGDINAVNAYNGEYMMQYSWSEFTLGQLTAHLYSEG